MHTISISVTEYASRLGCSTRKIQKALKDGLALPNTVGHRKTGRNYIIYALKTWYDEN